jgi:hypothetical protein
MGLGTVIGIQGPAVARADIPMRKARGSAPPLIRAISLIFLPYWRRTTSVCGF